MSLPLTKTARLALTAYIGFFTLLGFQKANADEYHYDAATLRCRVYVTKTAIGEPEQLFGDRSIHHVVTLFRGIDSVDRQKTITFSPRFTSHGSGTPDTLESIYNTSVPNPFAQDNWPIATNASTFRTVLEIPGLQAIPMGVQLRTNGLKRDAVIFDAALPKLTLQDVHSVISATTVSGIPKFDASVKMSASYNNEYSQPIETPSLGWYFDFNEYALPIEPKLRDLGSVKIVKVQASYPPDKFNGLSYHLTVGCHATGFVGKR